MQKIKKILRAVPDKNCGILTIIHLLERSYRTLSDQRGPKFDIIGMVCKLQVDKVQNHTKSLISGNAISRNDILKIGYFTEQSVQWRQIKVCKIQNDLRNAD